MSAAPVREPHEVVGHRASTPPPAATYVPTHERHITWNICCEPRHPCGLGEVAANRWVVGFVRGVSAGAVPAGHASALARRHDADERQCSSAGSLTSGPRGGTLRDNDPGEELSRMFGRKRKQEEDNLGL